MDKQAAHKILIQEASCCKNCQLGCDLLDGQDPHVVGAGNLDSKIMFCAEAPGEQETIYRRCLTPPGKSGNIYENCLTSLGLSRDEVYTCNVMICRPPKNRDPEPYEVLKCRPFLERQISLVQPQLIVAFGRFAASSFLSDFKITRDHGKVKRSEQFGVDIFPLYHPAYVGCYAKIEDREAFKRDFVILKKLIDTRGLK